MKFLKFLNTISLLSDKPKTENLASIAFDNLGFIRPESRMACVSSDEPVSSLRYKELSSIKQKADRSTGWA
jgi:hypothetical protein